MVDFGSAHDTALLHHPLNVLRLIPFSLAQARLLMPLSDQS